MLDIPSNFSKSVNVHLVCLVGIGLMLTTYANASGEHPTHDQFHAPKDIRKFLNNHCVDCHDQSTAEGGLDITALSDQLELSNKDRWIRIFDRVAENEMPPKEYGSVDKVERKEFLTSTGDWINRVQRNEYETLGRVKARRLNNLQLERTLHDLLGVDIPLASLMPEEPRTGGFNTVADHQPMSHFQLQQHLDVVDAALDEAFHRAVTGDADLKTKYLDAKRIARRNPRRRTREPEIIDNRAVVWSGVLVFYGRIPATRAPEDGWYRFKIRAKALKPPKNKNVWCSIRSGECYSSAPLMSWVGAFEAEKDDKEITVEAWLPKNHMLEIRPGDITLKRARFRGGQVGTGEGGRQNVPGVSIHSIEMTRIYKNGDDDRIRNLLFGNLKLASKKNDQNSAMTFDGTNPEHAIAEQIHSFSQLAFRRTQDKDSIQPYIDLALQSFESDRDLVHALRTGYRAILCSPRFLYFHEQAGRLDDFAIASRLSYFLWNRMPDNELFRLATTNQLSDKQVIKKQVDRMLNDPKGRHFVRDFADQWLDLHLIDFTEPDRRLYPGFDVIVQNSMVEETHLYLQQMLDNDLDIGRLIHSSTTFLNSRLGEYYGINGVQGDKMKQVSIPKESPFGGLLTQGSITKVTANGTNTSPVLRGVWISERLLGQEIPPPPQNVPAIEPDIRGAKTIREQLAKHKADENCASCHRKIDPPGFALENFDPSGRWRTHYVTRKGKKKSKLPVDSSYEMSDGSPFDGIKEFKRLVLNDRERLARNVVEKLLVFGTGQTVQFADRVEIKTIAENSKDSNFGFRSILHSVVTSDTFLHK